MQACIFWEVDKVFLKVLWDLDGTHIMARPRGARGDKRSIVFHLHLPSSIRRLTPRRQAPSKPHPLSPTPDSINVIAFSFHLRCRSSFSLTVSYHTHRHCLFILKALKIWNFKLAQSYISYNSPASFKNKKPSSTSQKMKSVSKDLKFVVFCACSGRLKTVFQPLFFSSGWIGFQPVEKQPLFHPVENLFNRSDNN